SEVSVEEGDQVGANAAVVEVVDPSVVEMDGIVDEIDILLLSEGLAASITVDALPGRALEGFVSEIAPVATIQQGVVTYPVRVQIQIPEDLQLRDGLSAVADLVLEQQLNVLLIPQGAIFGTFQTPTAKVETSDGIVERPVVLGDSDDFWTEVRAGLSEGDRVVMQSSSAADNPFGAFRQFRSGGGGNFSGVVTQGRPR
ncbi:MAG: HlyD family efflux transporter periplasmic adaptor subunit, partial [Chloroflexi bacterium]|nr:HlyD family efflux transporter periplasmic adaptor subunit [Chloroflexota bacterium]